MTNEFSIGTRVAGSVRGQGFTGTVTSRAIKDQRLTSVIVTTDQPLTTPIGRTVGKAFITGDGLADLALIEP